MQACQPPDTPIGGQRAAANAPGLL